VFWAFSGHAQAIEPLPVPAGPVLLTLTGAIERTNAPGEARFDRAMLEALGTAVIRTKTVWYDEEKTFEGVLLQKVLDEVGARGAVLKALGLNDYEVAIPSADAAHYGVVLAMRMDGRMLTARDKGPLWIVYPRDDHAELQDERYDQRWVWQLNRLRIE
jgi:hypothetical protein